MAMSWGQSVYTGATGSPSAIDYRGVVRYMEEVESPDMCGTLGSHSPAALFDVMQNGNSNNRARWPSTIVISMAAECDASGNGWAGMEDVHRFEERQGHERPRFDVAHARRSQDELV